MSEPSPIGGGDWQTVELKNSNIFNKITLPSNWRRIFYVAGLYGGNFGDGYGWAGQVKSRILEFVELSTTLSSVTAVPNGIGTYLHAGVGMSENTNFHYTDIQSEALVLETAFQLRHIWTSGGFSADSWSGFNQANLTLYYTT